MAEPPPSTDVIQTVQRRNWILIIVGTVGVMVLLVAAGWVAGAIANNFALSPEEQALIDLRAADDGLSATGTGADGSQATINWSGELDTAVLTAEGLPTVGEDEEIAVWYRIGEEYTRADAFTPEAGAATVILAELWPDEALIDLTVDPRGGSSSGEPIADPFLTIEP